MKKTKWSIRKLISTKGLTKKLINKYSSLNSAKCISSDGLYNCFYLYQLTYLQLFSGTTKVHSWTSEAMSEESIENSSTSDNSFAPKWIDDYTLPELKFNENSLRQMVCFFFIKI